jgi:hypothetical protein
MKIDKINHLYFFLASLFFILMLNATFYYFYKQKTSVNPITEEVAKFVESDNVAEEELETEISVLVLPGISSDDYILGNIDAGIEMIIYDDPTGAFSPEYFPRVKTLEDEFANDLKVALRLLPLGMHKYSSESCLSVICAGEQGKYFEAYKDLLVANTERAINQEYLFNFANKLEIDDKEFKTCLAGTAVQNKLDKWIKEADDYYIMGAPNTFINNQPYSGAYQLDDFTDSAGFERVGLRTVVERLLSPQQE